MKFLKYLFISFLFFTNTQATCQSLGKHDKDIRWKSIETKNVKVIFPEGTNLQAQRIADVIEYIHNNKTKSVGDKSKKIEVVLQNQQTISNGFVTLSPYRSEFYAIGPQDQSSLGTPDWLDLLSIHEYRHALQYANANRGLTKLFHIIAGEDGWAGAQALSIPSWYLEGDAVLIESLLSENGRGRNPYFFKEQRALFLEDEIYSYHKAQNGSYKNIVPNIYPLGFMISNYLRNEYSIETGSKILAEAGKYKYGFYPFSSAMKKHTGHTTTEMYQKSAVAIQKKWKDENNLLKKSESTLVPSKTSKTVTHYTFPQYLNNGNIVALKRSFKETPYLIELKKNKEVKLTTVGIAAQEYLSIHNNYITWTEHQKDARHANNNYSDIIVYDYNTSKKKKITKNKRYFSPNFSFDGAKITAVQYKENIKYTIDILEASSGKLLETLPNPQNDFLSTPKWTTNNASIVYLAKRSSKLAFFRYDFSSNEITQISDWTTVAIGQYNLSESKIYFSASFSGIDNIYSLDLNGKRNIQQISSVQVGAYFPEISLDDKKIVYSEFTTKGYKLHEQNLPSEFKRYKIPNLEIDNFYDLKTTEIEHAILDSIPKKEYKIDDYKGFFKGTKLHSWGLTTSTTSANTLGANVQLQNILNDFRGNIAVLHNLNEGTNSLRANLGYGKGLFNWNIKSATLKRNSTYGLSGIAFPSDFNELFYGGGFSIPISRFKGNYSQSFEFETNYIQHDTYNYEISNKIGLNFGAIESSITLSNIRRTALQNVAPRWGQYLNINYNKSTSDITAEKTSFSTIFFFPGLAKNHSLNIVFNGQKELLKNQYRYSDTFRYARGYDGISNDQVVKFSAKYELPVLYPDFGIWGLTYFKRIRFNAFFDASALNYKSYKIIGTKEGPIVEITSKNIHQNSFGGELIFDNLYFNIAPISLGLRQSFLLNNNISNPYKTSAFEIFIQLGF